MITQSELRKQLESCRGKDLETSVLQNNLAVLLQADRQFEEANKVYRSSLAGLQKHYGENHPAVAQSLSNRAALHRDQQVYPEAEKVFQFAIRIWNQGRWPDKSEMVPLSEVSDFKQQLAWSEFPSRNHLAVYGKALRELRARVIEEAARGEEGIAHQQLRETLSKLAPWFHDVQITDKINTCPENPGHPLNRWRVIEPFVDADISGKSVLDIGCNSGFFSLEMKRRGASRVVGIDVMPHILAQSRFTSHWFDLPIELLQWDVYNVDALGSFDIVLFLGVLYHLKHPLYALEKVSEACSGDLYFQSMVRGRDISDFEPLDDYPMAERAVFDEPAYPRLFFIEKSFNGDSSNWWAATRSCLKAMLRVSGFKSIRDTNLPDVFVCGKK